MHALVHRCRKPENLVHSKAITFEILAASQRCDDGDHHCGLQAGLVSWFPRVACHFLSIQTDGVGDWGSIDIIGVLHPSLGCVQLFALLCVPAGWD